MFLIRTLHKWFGLILGLQFLLWAVSGAVMALLDHHKVSAMHAIAPVEAPAAAGFIGLGDLEARLGEPIRKVQLKPLSSAWVYVATTAAGVRLANASTGAPVRIDEAAARAIAVQRFTGDQPITSATLLEKSTLETRTMKGPIWRVQFADPDKTALMVSAIDGDVLGAKNDAWRLWDLAWMFHIMDYTERQSFNHPLIITVATGVAWLCLSGMILLFRSFRRSDVAWIVDPIEALLARRKRTAP